ncbi:MAG: hypothetical protein HYW52_08150 [Gemmatimonadetes bacterium]|nr:hypothetical protein [Gemmatimonadota bacterium]
MGHRQRREPGRIAVVGREVDLGARECRQLRESRGALAEVEVIGDRRGLAGGAALAVGFPNHHQAADVLERRGAQQHSVYYAEDGGDGADAERQRQHRRGGEAGGIPQAAECVAEIV